MIEYWLAYYWARWSAIFWPYGAIVAFAALGLLFSARRGVRRAAAAIILLAAPALAVDGWRFTASAVSLMHARSQAHEQLQNACAGAGEQIERTVVDVAGLYLAGAATSDQLMTFHEKDGRPETWVTPLPGRPLYSFVELRPFGKQEVARITAQYQLEEKPGGRRPRLEAQIRTSTELLPEPSAAYAVEWETHVIWSAPPHRVIEDETRVVDRAGGRVIATRRLVSLTDPYLTLEGGRWHWNARDVPLAYCDGHAPAHDPAWRDGNPRTSMEFVARVLRPRPLSPEFNAARHDLAPGSGYRERDVMNSCRFVTVGQGVSAEDLKIRRIPDRHDSKDETFDTLEFRIAGTDDVLICRDMFRVKRHREMIVYFADGPVWRWPELKARISDPRKSKP